MMYTFIITLTISLVCIALFFGTLEHKKINKKTFGLYTFVSILIFYVFAIIFGFALQKEVQQNYIFIQLVILLLGGLHVWGMFKALDWSSRASFFSELFYTLFLTGMGAISILTCFKLIDSFSVNTNDAINATANIYARTFILFPLPYLVLKIYDLWTQIPPAYFKVLYIKKGEGVPIIEEHPRDLMDFRLFKNLADNNAINVTVPAPHKKDIALGIYFKYFIYRYNQDEPDDTIEWKWIDAAGERQYYDWYFYKKNKWWQMKKYLDPDKSIGLNQIGEKDAIIAKRIKRTLETTTIPNTKTPQYNVQ